MTRNWNATDHSVLTLADAPDKWFLVQTNYDYWTAPPAYDDRRKLAKAAMRARGQAGFNTQAMFSVLVNTTASGGSRGVFNSETMYTNALSTTYNQYKTMVWK